MTDDTTFRVLRWLSPLDPHVRHRILCANRIDGVGCWVLTTKEFREWSDGGGGSARDVLFCYGEPGVGKTYLSSLVLDHLANQGREKDVAVAGIYYDFMSQNGQSPADMLGAILKQVIDTGNILEYINYGFPDRTLGLPDLAIMLKKALASRRRAFICIDGLDECLAEHRALLLESLREIRYLQGVRIFFTGRRNIRDEIEKYLGDVDIIPIDPSANDLMKFARTKLEKVAKDRGMDNYLKEDILRDIPGKLSETFLAVSLVVDLILAEPPILDRRKKLKEMREVQSLGEAYAATLARLGAEKGSNAGVGIETLMWVAHSERVLRTDELCHALGAKTVWKGAAARGVPPIQRLLECSLGLVTVDVPSSTVRLAHYSLQEYLRQSPDVFVRPHSTMARGCLEYLRFRCGATGLPRFRWGTTTLSPAAIATMPEFAEYASCYWGIHAMKGDIEDVKPLAFTFLNQYHTHISAKLLLMNSSYWKFYVPLKDPFRGFSILHCVAFFGIAALIVELREKKNRGNVNARDAFESTPLLWAVRMGSLEGVKALLEWSGVDPNLADRHGHSPLSVAAMNGHDEIVRLLLTQDYIDPSGARGGFCRVPLVLAASEGRETIVEALLARGDVNPNQLEPFLGRSPLAKAAEKGHQGVVRLLLARGDVDPNGLEKDCDQAPLSLAAAGGHQGVVELLLARGDINPGVAQEAFRKAAEHGREGVVSLLLTRDDVGPDARSTSGRTPLSWAAEKGHEGVVRLLIARKDVDPDARNASGRTPLSWAAEKGHEGVVRLLIARDGVRPGLADIGGRTPLSWAAQGGHKGTVKLLLALDAVDPELADLSGRTPLSWAAGDARERIVNLLLSRAGVLPRWVSKWSRLIIQRASSEGYERQERS